MTPPCAKCGTPQDDCEALKALFMGNPGLVNSKNEHGWTLLHRAARKCRRELLEALLVPTKADINAKSNGGETPLHAGAQGCGRSTVGQWLRCQCQG